MHFLFPWMLLGTLGVSVPIAIHLLNRYRFKEVDWGAMELLRKALVVRAKRVRLEDLLLLLLRCAIIALIALALSRPVLAPESAQWLGQTSDVSVVIALDGSFSMGHRPGARSRFDEATDRIRAIARTLKPGSKTTLLLMGERPRFPLRNEGHDADRLEAKLKQAAPLPERLNLDACLDAIGSKEFLDELKAPAIEYYIVSDAQTNSWQQLSPKARAAVEQMGKAGNVYFVPVGGISAENLAVTRFDLKTGLVHKGVTVEIEVANHGKEAHDGPVTLLVNDVPVDQRLITKLAPSRTATVTLFARLDKDGPARLTAKLDGDPLPIDNVRHAVVENRAQTRLLYVRDKAPQGDARDFVLSALQASDNKALQLDTIDRFALAKQSFGGYQTVILSNVSDMPDSKIRDLYSFVEEGGGLLVFLGEANNFFIGKGKALLNARLQHDGKPLLPGDLVEKVEQPAGVQVQPLEHPLGKLLASLPGQVVSEARVNRYFKLKLGPGGVSAMNTIGADDPLVAEKTVGLGKVVLFASAPDRAWTNMVTEPGFYPILLHEALTFVSRKAHERSFAVSEPLRILLPAAAKESKTATFQPQGGSPTTREVIARDGQLIAELPVAEQPGFYEVRPDKGELKLLVPVNVDPTESNVQTLSGAALAEALRGLPVRIMAESDALETSIREGRIGRELWKELLLALLVLLVVEGLLARYFSQRKVDARASEGGEGIAVTRVASPAPAAETVAS